MDFADFRFPGVFSRMGKLLPAPLSGLPLMAALDIARRRQWLTVPDYLNGKTFQIHIVDMGLQIQFTCVDGRFKPSFNRLPDEQIDVRLSANAVDYFQMASGMADADTLFFQRKLKIEGDTELGVAVKYWLDASERPAWLVTLATKLG